MNHLFSQSFDFLLSFLFPYKKYSEFILLRLYVYQITCNIFLWKWEIFKRHWTSFSSSVKFLLTYYFLPRPQTGSTSRGSGGGCKIAKTHFHSMEYLLSSFSLFALALKSFRAVITLVIVFITIMTGTISPGPSEFFRQLDSKSCEMGQINIMQSELSSKVMQSGKKERRGVSLQVPKGSMST